MQIDDVTLGFLFQLAEQHPTVAGLLDSRAAEEIPSSVPRTDAIGIVLMLWALRRGAVADGQVFRAFCERASDVALATLFEHLRDLNLSNLNLSGVSFQGADMSGARFQHATLTGADLTRTRLRRASLEQARLDQTLIDFADLSDARLKAAVLTRVHGKAVTCTGAILEGATLLECAFTAVSRDGGAIDRPLFGRANFQGATLEGTVFEDADLRGANFDFASVTDCRFRRCLLSGARLRSIVSERNAFIDCEGTGAVGLELKDSD